MKPLKILLVGAAMAPLVKEGGLADVMESLPIALRNKKIDARVILPAYKVINHWRFKLTKTKIRLPLNFNNQTHHLRIWRYQKNHSSPLVWLIDDKHFFKDLAIYPAGIDKASGFLKEEIRFAFFCQAVVNFLKHSAWQPDIVHLNDWHTGLIPLLIKKSHLPHPPKTLLTIHNLAYQGIFPAREINQLINNDCLPSKGNINFLQTGILHADKINTVSPTYAKEIMTRQYGNGLDPDLKKRRKDLTGILNGLNIESFNPQTDPAIFKNFNLPQIKNKTLNKINLQTELGLPVSNELPLFGLVSRLVEQKGLDILLLSLKQLRQEKFQLIILGTGEKKYETAFAKLAKQNQEKIKLILNFDVALANKIYAASDFFLMPSRFEPCGLGQMISMRYGTLPLVHRTGGLKDTVIDAKKTNQGTGLVFTNYHPASLTRAIKRGLKLFTNRSQMSILISNAMKTDFSWNVSVGKYITLYKKLLK